MFDFLTYLGKNKELEALMQEIDSNLANNYKDAAQEALARFEQKMCDLTAQGSLKPKLQKEYTDKLWATSRRSRAFHIRTRSHTGNRIPDNISYLLTAL